VQITDKPKIDDLRQELEAHFLKALSPRMREAFARFALENFETFENFEKACELVCAQEITFGRFPIFPRFLELYREHRRTSTGAYAEYKALPPIASGYSGTAHDVARRKAKVHVAGFLKRPDFRAEAIDEATMKGIDLAEIGIFENAATDISTAFSA
jgi:hypothetical protein